MLIPNNFIEENFDSNILTECPCNEEDENLDMCYATWEEIDEDDPNNKITRKEWLHQESPDGFSVYGAYFLLHQFGKDYNSILRYFYGNDFSYRTIIKNGNLDNIINTGNMSSYCNTSSSSANLLTFLHNFEGTGSFCDNGAGYVSYNLGDGTITVGKGVTNHVISSSYAKDYINANNWQQYFHTRNGSYYINSGECLPTQIVDQIQLLSIETSYAAHIDSIASLYGITLTQYQKDALTSFNYNLGSGYTEKLISAYASDGYEGLWNVMKEYKNATINGVRQELSGLKKRRKAEFALFVTGDYTDQGLFYSRSLNNYDDYNSESVIERAAICSMKTDGFAFPLPKFSKFSCTSPFGYRISPTDGKTQLHGGLDLAIDGGTDIYASKDGKIVEALDGISGSKPSTGNYVKILHDDGTHTIYMHMLKGSVAVKVGDEVKQGDKIGEVGSTGESTGNHLHFTIVDANGKKVDPYDYLDLSMLNDTSSCHQ